MGNVIAELADNSIGTWKLNLAKSKRTPPSANPPATFTLIYEAAVEGVMGTVTGQLEDGTPIHFSGPVMFDGKDYPVAGAPWDTYSFTPIDAHTCTFVDKKTGGKFYILGRQVISEDGKTLTITSEGIDADGTAVTAFQVYEKQ